MGLISGVMQNDLPVTVARADVQAIAPTRLWWLGLAMWQLGWVAGLVSVSVCVGSCGGGASGVPVCGGCRIDRQISATEFARDVIARKAWVSSPLEQRFRDFFRRPWLSLPLSLVLSVSVSLLDRLPPPFSPTKRNVKWTGPCAVVAVGSLSPSGCPW